MATRKKTTKKPAPKKTTRQPVPAKAKTKKITAAPAQRLQKPRWQHLYAVSSLAVLFATSLLWALFGARLQQQNADQLINPYLFDSREVFSQALLPSTHSFLLKWPLFYLIKLLNYSTASYIATTVVVSLLTVGALAYVIHRIERRPAVFGTLMLALASVLLLVPAVPAAGALLPVNFAMLATRNLEYVVYLASLVALARSQRLKSWSFGLATIGLGLLVTSDKLFLSLSLGGALGLLAISALFRNRQLVKLALYWLLAGGLAMALAWLTLWLLQTLGISQFTQAANDSPYKLILTVNHLGLGAAFVVVHGLTNFGANPAYDVGTLRTLPEQFASRLIRPWGVSYLLNLGVLLASGFLTLRLAYRALAAKAKTPADRPVRLSLMLLFSAIAASLAFVATDHYFAVDSRYLVIYLLAGFVGAATALRQTNKFSDRQWAAAGLVLAIGTALGLLAVQRVQATNQLALAPLKGRNQLISQALRNHPVGSLLGDYWRVVPIKQASQVPLAVTPLSNCTEPAQVLSSQAWQPDLTQTSFAYLLTSESQQARFPACSLEQVVGAYGQPNASTLIAGQLDDPKELLLYYDHGTQGSAPEPAPQTPATSTVLPISIEQLPHRHCNADTIVNVVAHQDDDLLFMSPDLLGEVQSQNCVRSIYLTAGDAGSDQLYWTGREKAVEAAYSKMLGSDSIWVERIAQIDEHQFAIVANPRDNPRISLIFLRLPDGNLQGQGFADNQFASLAKLDSGAVGSITSVDGQSTYTQPQLVAAVGRLVQNYQPDQIHTQDPLATSQDFPDHSDHLAVGRLLMAAHQQTAGLAAIPVTYYIGYPIRQLDVNIGQPELAAKTAAFLAYAGHDGAVCQSSQECMDMPTLGSYLQRMYSTSH